MSYGIDSEIQQKADMYRDNTQPLMQSYQQNSQLIDLLALQRIKSEKEAAARQMQMQQPQQPQTIADQREQEVFQMTRDDVARNVGAVAQQQQARAQQRMAQVMGLPSQSSPNMQKFERGGIVHGFAGDEGSFVGTNPGNLRDYNQGFDGTAGATDNGFIEFESPQHGVRAVDKVLQTFGSKYGINTIAEAIRRYAPPNENDTDNYINFVARRLGLDPNTNIDLSDPTLRHNVVSAIVKMESGADVSPAQIKQGVDEVEGQPPTGTAGVGNMANAAVDDPEGLWLRDEDGYRRGNAPVVTSVSPQPTSSGGMSDLSPSGIAAPELRQPREESVPTFPTRRRFPQEVTTSKYGTVPFYTPTHAGGDYLWLNQLIRE